MAKSKHQFNRRHLSFIAFVAIYVGVIIVFSCLNENFLVSRNFLTILKHVSVTGIAALGLTFVVAVGHTDVSFYLIACFSAMYMSWLISKGFGAFPAILLGLIGAAVFGIASGVAVGVARLPDIIITIAIGSIAFGCAYIFSDGMKIYTNFKTSGISFLNDGAVLGIPTPVFFMIILYIAGFIVLEKTRVGVAFYSTGSNKTAAWYSGINVRLTIVFAFIICILMSAFAGMINTASKGNGEVKTALTFMMPCYTAVFIGKAMFRRPCMIGTFLGAFLVQMISNGINLNSIPYYIGDIVTSCMLITALLISTLNQEDAGNRPGGKKKAGIPERGVAQ